MNIKKIQQLAATVTVIGTALTGIAKLALDICRTWSTQQQLLQEGQ